MKTEHPNLDAAIEWLNFRVPNCQHSAVLLSHLRHLLAAQEWSGVESLITPGYYWCRLGETDDKPTVVLISRPEEDQDLQLYEFSDTRGQRLIGYGPEWQFKPVMP